MIQMLFSQIQQAPGPDFRKVPIIPYLCLDKQFFIPFVLISATVKPVLSGHLKIDKTKGLNGKW